MVVLHSSVAEMQPYQGDLPFAAIADPEKHLYAEFGVESSLRAVLSANALGAAIRGAISGRSSKPKGEKGLGLPADFLIAPDGRVFACKYGVHANDQWSVDDLLLLARLPDDVRSEPHPLNIYKREVNAHQCKRGG